jgi:hypothetical protein
MDHHVGGNLSIQTEMKMNRSRVNLIVAAAVTLTVSSGAHARSHPNSPSFQPGARASAAGVSATDIRQQCSEEARARWGTNSQDMQTPRDFAYRTCMFDHGVRNP